MGKRSELKENILANKMEHLVQWAVAHRPHVLIGTGVIVVSVLLSSVFIIRNGEVRDMNWTRLSQAVSYFNQKDFPAARQILTDVQQQDPRGVLFLYATYHLGEIDLAENKYDDAVRNFSSVIASSGKNPLRALALTNLGYAQEEKHDFAEAAKTYRKFLDEYAEHFMAARTQLALGRALALSGDKQAAKTTLSQLVDLYPTSPWAENARRIMDKIETR